MVFNTDIYKASKLNAIELVVLLIINAKKYEELADYQMYLVELMHLGWVEFVKPKKKDDAQYLSARLTKKAKEFLRDLETAEITEESKTLAGALIGYYEASAPDKIGNRRKVLRDVSWFLAETDFTAEQIENTVAEYLYGTSEAQYVVKLENLVHKLPNAFATRYELANSKLYELLRK